MAGGRIHNGYKKSRSATGGHSQSRRRVPDWVQKQFCVREGGIRWKDFLEAKQYLAVMDKDQKVMQWNDLAGKECLDIAHRRYWARNGGPPCDIPLPNPSVYVDEIDWNVNADPQLILEWEAARIEIEEWKERGESSPVANRYVSVRFDDIIPTGWDVEDSHGPELLTGMIVGDKGDS